MQFNSIEYVLIFLPLVVILYHISRTINGGRYVNYLIFVASYYFYGYGSLIYLPPLIVSSVLDYSIGKKIDKSETISHRKILFIVSMTIDLGLLFFFKYTTWFSSSLNSFLGYLGVSASVPVISIMLPPGISFYTFQTMCYTIDIYNKKIKPCHNFIDYMTYVSFWPQLVAGPIERAKNLLPQLQRVRQVISTERAISAILIILWGLFKKIVLADNFGQIVDSIDGIFKSQVDWNTTGLGLIYGYAFAGQIYCDFSAYTDIARGSAMLIGVELMRNFRTPYFSISPSDFWRRWHISLSTWIRDYLYIPLGGNRVSRTRALINLMIVMGLIGLWHGAGVMFIAWGLYHGILLVIYRILPIDLYLNRSFQWLGLKILRQYRVSLPLDKWGSNFGSVTSMAIMFQLACFGWILFRADTQIIWPVIKTIIDLPYVQIAPLFAVYIKGLISLWIILLITDTIGYRIGNEFIDAIFRMPAWLQTVFIATTYFAIVLLGKREGVQFIYFQF